MGCLDNFQPIAVMREVTIRLGRTKMVAATTGISVLMSVTATIANLYVFGFLDTDYVTLVSIMLAVIIPLLVAFPVSWLTVSMVFFMHQLEAETRHLATYDALTGLRNRRAFLEEAHIVHHTIAQRNQQLALLLLDLDHFKQINDTYGHATGDDVLERFGKIVHQIAHSGTLAARIGGEEFAFLLPEQTNEQAWQFAERLHQALRTLVIEKEGSTIRCSASIGLVVCSSIVPIEKALSFADKALYQAKANGRNQSICYAPQPPVTIPADAYISP